MSKNIEKPDQLNKNHNNKITQGAMKTLKVGTNLATKGASFVARTTVRLALSIIRKVVTAVSCSMVATIIIFILVISCLTWAIVDSAYKMTGETNALHESPELTRAYLNMNQDKFKNKIHELIQDPKFNSFIVNGEFDNAYTKLVYGGDSAFTQEELKGYARSDEDISWIKFSKEGEKLNKSIDKADRLLQDVNNSS